MLDADGISVVPCHAISIGQAERIQTWGPFVVAANKRASGITVNACCAVEAIFIRHAAVVI